MTNLIGQSLGRYHILEQLGEGGMAIVYKAYDTRLESDVAIKVIRTDTLAPNVLGRTLKRFEREAKALARLTHANIVKVSDYGEFEGHPFLVMPYLPGGNLKERLKKGVLPWPEAVHILIPIALALEYAHQQGVIHRDVKPSNILITESGDPMLTDFGVAKVMEDEVTVDLTGTAMAVGTPEYMAPEQAISKSVDHRADIYSLGIVFYEMVTGRKPYVADTPLAVLFKQASEPLPRPKQFASALPDKVEQTILKALAKKPEDRYQTMGEFAAALERCFTGTTVDQRKLKSEQPSAKPLCDVSVDAQNKNNRRQREATPSAPLSTATSTTMEPSKPQPAIGVRETSRQRMILITGIVVVAAVLLLGMLLKSVLDSKNRNILVGFVPATATLEPIAALSFTPPSSVTFSPAKKVTSAPTTIQTFTPTLFPIILNPQGLSIITPDNASQVRQIVQWNMGINVESAVFSSTNGTVTSVSFSTDGATLASGSENGSVNLWRVSDGSLLRKLQGSTSWVTSVAFSPDGKTLASGSRDNNVWLWNISDGVLLHILKGHTDQVTSVAFSPDGKTLVSGSVDRTARLWNVSDGTLLRTLQGHTNFVTAVSFSPDGKILASGSYDNTVRLWSAADGTLLRSLTLDYDLFGVDSVAFSPDGEILAIGSEGSIVQLWHVSNGVLLHTLEGNTRAAWCVAFSPDGKTLASGSWDNTVRLWRVSDGTPMVTLEGHTSYVLSVAFSPDGTALASGSDDRTIRFWGIPAKE